MRTSLTRAGRLTLTAGLVVLALALRSRAPGLVPLAVLLLAAVPVAWAQAARLGALQVTAPVRPQVTSVGGRVEVSLVLAGQRRRPGLRLRVGGPAASTAPEVVAAVEVAVPGAPSTGAASAVAVSLPALRRGGLASVSVEVADLGVLGLLARSRTVLVPVDVLVVPRWRPLDLQQIRRTGDEEDPPPPWSPALPRGVEPRGMREWRSGDEPRAVSWRATARTGRLTVREWDAPGADGLALVVQLAQDSAAPVPAGAREPLADPHAGLVEALASVGAAALRAGRRLSLVHAIEADGRSASSGGARTGGQEPTGAGRLVPVRVREDLTLASLLGGLAEVPSLRTTLAGLAAQGAAAAGRGGTVVLGVGIGWGEWSPDELVEVARRVTGSGCTLQVVVGRTHAPLLPPGAEEALRAVAALATVTDAGDLLAEAARPAARPHVDLPAMAAP